MKRITTDKKTKPEAEDSHCPTLKEEKNPKRTELQELAHSHFEILEY
jgi:hypothetical protein